MAPQFVCFFRAGLYLEFISCLLLSSDQHPEPSHAGQERIDDSLHNNNKSQLVNTWVASTVDVPNDDYSISSVVGPSEFAF